VVDNAVESIITIDEKGTVLTVNPAAEKIFDYTAEEMIGRNVKFLMPEPYHSQHDRYLTNYLQTGQAKIIGIGREVTGRRKDGSQFPMYLGVSEFHLEGRRCFTGIVQDISERKRAENVSHFLADASRSLAAVVDYASTLQKVAYLAVPFFAEWCMVHIVRDDGSLRQLAAAHVDPNQSELAQRVGRRCTVYPSGLVGPGHIIKTGKSELIDEVSDSLIESVAPDPELRRLLKQFGLKSYIGAPLTVRGKVVGVLSFYSADPKRKYDKLDLAVAEDLALRSATAVENALLYGELRDADRRKDDFLAMLAHELRNPLAPIRSGLDLLAMEGAEPDVLRVMQQQTEHMVRLVDDLLDVSRILRGKVHLQPETIDIRTAVQRAIDAARLANVAAGHELTVSMPPDPICVYADPVRLTQVITNLLTNSNKYTARGGHIELSVRQEGQSVAVSVRDDGIGMRADLLPHVFDLFTQADRSLERTQGGLGIGLTLVRTLVEMHHGTVSAFSQGEGKGSEFTVRLPVHKAAMEKAPVQTAPAQGEARRILIVEDNVGTAKILSRLLSKLGNHEIRMVHDGLSALEAAKAQRPEVVLLDIGLPQMDGYEVAQRLRQQPGFQETVLVALTGYGTDEDRRRSTEAGFDHHLVKPASLENLRRVLAYRKLVPSTVS
jgi:PAS domain S-box-containing protein